MDPLVRSHHRRGRRIDQQLWRRTPRYLAANDVKVIEVNQPHRLPRAHNGKDDVIDAEAAARKVPSGEATAVAEDSTGSSRQSDNSMSNAAAPSQGIAGTRPKPAIRKHEPLERRGSAVIRSVPFTLSQWREISLKTDSPVAPAIVMVLVMSLRIQVVVVSLALVAAGCGSSQSATIDSDGAGEQPTSAVDAEVGADESEPADAVGDAAGDDDGGAAAADSVEESAGVNRSPLAEFLGDDFSAHEQSETEIRRLGAEAEVKTAECMQELGFEYIPRDTTQAFFFGEVGEIDSGSDEWIQTYGFGITTQRFPQSMVGPDLAGVPDERMSGPPDDDPNTEYVESLSEAEREAYYQALRGDSPDFDRSTMSEEQLNEALANFRPGGCANEAAEELFDDGSFGPDQDFMAAFGDQLQNLYERVESDPRIVAAQAEVSSCVSTRGLDWPGDIEKLYERYEEPLRGIGAAMMDPFAGTGLDPEDMTQEELEEFFESQGPPQLSDDEKTRLGQLQEQEIALAIAVNDCGGGPRGTEDLYNQVRIEYEQRFIDENAEQLEPFRDDD